MTNNLSSVLGIFNRLPGQSFPASEKKAVKAHQIKVTNRNGEAKICDLVDLRLAAGDDWHVLNNGDLTIIGTDGPVEDFKSMYWILNGLNTGAGLSWDEIKSALYNNEDAWL